MFIINFFFYYYYFKHGNITHTHTHNNKKYINSNDINKSILKNK